LYRLCHTSVVYSKQQVFLSNLQPLFLCNDFIGAKAKYVQLDDISCHSSKSLMWTKIHVCIPCRWISWNVINNVPVAAVRRWILITVIEQNIFQVIFVVFYFTAYISFKALAPCIFHNGEKLWYIVFICSYYLCHFWPLNDCNIDIHKSDVKSYLILSMRLRQNITFSPCSCWQCKQLCTCTCILALFCTVHIIFMYSLFLYHVYNI